MPVANIKQIVYWVWADSPEDALARHTARKSFTRRRNADGVGRIEFSRDPRDPMELEYRVLVTVENQCNWKDAKC